MNEMIYIKMQIIQIYLEKYILIYFSIECVCPKGLMGIMKKYTYTNRQTDWLIDRCVSEIIWKRWIRYSRRTEKHGKGIIQVLILFRFHFSIILSAPYMPHLFFFCDDSVILERLEKKDIIIYCILNSFVTFAIIKKK